jgi:hypothetical protein
MIYDSIKPYRIQLDPEGTMPNIDVGVRVDGRDIPDARVNYVAMIFVDRVLDTWPVRGVRVPAELRVSQIEG